MKPKKQKTEWKKLCRCVVKTIEINGQGVNFCMNCLRPITTEDWEQFQYNVAMNKTKSMTKPNNRWENRLGVVTEVDSNGLKTYIVPTIDGNKIESLGQLGDFIIKTLQQQREEGNEDSFWRGYKAGMYKMSKNGTCSELVPNTNKTIKVYIEDEIEPKLQNLKQENK